MESKKSKSKKVRIKDIMPSRVRAIHDRVRKGLEKCRELRDQDSVWQKFPKHLVNKNLRNKN